MVEGGKTKWKESGEGAILESEGRWQRLMKEVANSEGESGGTVWREG